MHYWLIKSEPSAFSIDDMCHANIEPWNGVRNYQARNFLRQMQVDDMCFFYHSATKNPGIVGLVRVVKTAYPDSQNSKFVCVDVKYQKHFPLLSLSHLKTIPEIRHLALFHQSRLSVQPVDQSAAAKILNVLEN